MENSLTVSLWETQTPSSSFWVQALASATWKCCYLWSKNGDNRSFHTSVEKGAGTQSKTPRFSMFLGQTGGKLNCQQSKEGNPNTLGGVFHGSLSKFGILHPEGFKITLPEAWRLMASFLPFLSVISLILTLLEQFLVFHVWDIFQIV